MNLSKLNKSMITSTESAERVVSVRGEGMRVTSGVKAGVALYASDFLRSSTLYFPPSRSNAYSI